MPTCSKHGEVNANPDNRCPWCYTAPANPNVCLHGQLRRQCGYCERDAEIAELRAEVERLGKLKPVVKALGAFAINWYPVQDDDDVTIIGIAEDFDVLVAAMDSLNAALKEK